MSAIAFLEEEEFRIKAIIYLYGTYASDLMAQAIENEINFMWNQPLVVVPVNMGYYKVRFQVKVFSETNERVKEMMLTNNSHEVNFVRIEEKNITERSMMGFGLGNNSGHWLVSDNLGTSTTAAHEFGHALGLPHPKTIDYRGSGFPPLMAPRGTIVDSEFQWNPLADTGAFGGTMKPIHRRVRQEEVLDMFFRANKISDKVYQIGDIYNTYYDEVGNPEV